MCKPLFSLLVVAACVVGSASGQTVPVSEARTHLDSLLELQPDTATLWAISRLSNGLIAEDMRMSLEVAQAGLTHGAAATDDGVLAELNVLAGLTAMNLGFLDTAHHYLARALTHQEATDVDKGIAEVYYLFGVADMMAGRNTSATTHLRKSLDLYTEIGDVKGRAKLHKRLAGLFVVLQRFEEGYAQAEYARDLALEVKDTGTVIFSTVTMARCLVGEEEGLDALELAREAVALAEVYGQPIYLYDALVAAAPISAAIEDHEETVAMLNRAADIAEVLYGDRYHSFTVVSNLGNAYYKLDQYEKSIEYVRLALAQSRAQEASRDLRGLYYTLASDFAALNQHDSAYHYARLESAAKDSLYAERNADALSELETRYETQEKQNQIERQSAELSTQRRNLYLTFGGLALALAVAGGVGYLALQLRRRNAEREVLIKEVHHRVKNNLQTLSSLLYLQGRHIDDEAASEAMRASQARVEAMGLIHRRLYTTDHLTGVAVAEYVPELVETLVDAFGADERVRVQTDVEPLVLDVDTAIPLGLILNELITNSLKYAFPAGTSGTLSVLLRKVDAELVLRVSDDGAGTGAVVGEGQSTGFGGELVDMLSQKLQGRLEVENTSGGYATTVYVGAYEVVGAAVA